VALAEMAIAGGLGFQADLSVLPVEEELLPAEILFSESTGRFVVEVPADRVIAFFDCFEELPVAKIGNVSEDDRIIICLGKDKIVVDTNVGLLESAWREPFVGW